MLAADTSLWTDDVWVADSTPVECGRSRETAKRSDLAGWAEYGHCASHSRYFWGLRLHLLCTLHRLPVGFALAGAKADERQVLPDILADPALTVAGTARSSSRTRTTTGTTSKPSWPMAASACSARPARASRTGRAPGSSGHWQVIESINATFKGQLDLEHHGATYWRASWSESCSASSP
jgi:hypothetical protein